MSAKHNGNYVHSLLFQCDNCGEPLAVPVVNVHCTLEEVDASPFDLGCKCGWTRRLLGAQAKRHWVDSWTFEQKPHN
jgi:hypothetical protein